MTATYKYRVIRLIVSRLHINYTIKNKANITINPLAPTSGIPVTQSTAQNTIHWVQPLLCSTNLNSSLLYITLGI